MADDIAATKLEIAEIPSADAVRSTIPPADSIHETVSVSDPGISRRPSLVGLLSRKEPPFPVRYEVGPQLGKGGMGTVRLAVDQDLARPVAMKQLTALPARGEQVHRFLREAQITAQLEHPGIVPVHDVGMDEEGRFYYVMRLVRGNQTLRTIIDRLREGDAGTHAKFTVEVRAQVIQQVARILHFAHKKGVVHRDVKPENIMVGPFGEVYVVDWGLAKVIGAAPEEVAPAVPPAAPSPSETQGIIGTPLYMAPEQVEGKVSPLSDVYSLVSVLYELATLHHPLGDGLTSSIEVFEKLKNLTPLPAWLHYDATNGRVARSLSIVCERGLAKDPAARQPSAAEVDAEIQRYLEGATPILCLTTLQLSLLNRWRQALIRRPLLAATFTFVVPIAALLIAIGWAIYSAL